MGVDVYPVLGRIVESIDSKTTVELMDALVDSRFNFGRIYTLWQWLSNRADFSIGFSGIEVCGIERKAYLKTKSEAEDFTKLVPQKSSAAFNYIFYNFLDEGRSVGVNDSGDPYVRYFKDFTSIPVYAFSIDELCEFDYDQVAKVVFPSAQNHPVAHPQGLTYRQLFEDSRHPNYFDFLKSAKEDGWQFVFFRFWG